MTVITPASEHLNGDDFDPRKDAQLRRRILEEQQNQAALQRVAERAEPRLQHEEALASPCSIAEANPPERIAQRLDRHHPLLRRRQTARDDADRRAG